jgi:tRNA threonylcarbamoyladenosine biosynthesis protein TsaB
LKILGIDTSSKFLSIALSEDGNIIKEENHLLDRRHSSQLVPKIKEMLENLNFSIEDVDVFVVGLGPGSFTGLRIGVSAVKGFGLVAKKPCIGVASIDALALEANGMDGTIVPIIDAKRGNVYSSIYERKGTKIIRLSGYLLLPIEKLVRKLKGDAVFLGDAISLYKEKITAINKDAIFLNERFWYPRAGNLIMLGLSRLKKQKRLDLGELQPIYLYPRDCQVKKPKA